MNNKVIYLIISSIFFLILLSCEKDSPINESSSENHFSNLLDMKIDEESNISISTISIEGNTPRVQVMGQFTSDREKLRPVNTFKINEVVVPYVTDRYMGNYPDLNLGHSSIIEDIAGENIRISVDNDFDSSIDNFEIYNPIPINFSIQQNQRSVSRKKGITLKWNPDSSIFREDNLVGVNLAYRGTNGAEFEQLDNIGFSKSTEDDGELFISEEELSIFPINSKVSINLVRGNYGVVEHTEDIETLILLYSIDNHRVIIID